MGAVADLGAGDLLDDERVAEVLLEVLVLDGHLAQHRARNGHTCVGAHTFTRRRERRRRHRRCRGAAGQQQEGLVRIALTMGAKDLVSVQLVARRFDALVAVKDGDLQRLELRGRATSRRSHSSKPSRARRAWRMTASPK